MAEALKTESWLAEPVQRIGQKELSPVYIADTVQTKLDDISKVSCVATPEDIASLGFAVAEAINALGNDLEQIKNNAPQDDAQLDPMQALAQQIAFDLVTADKPLVVSGTGTPAISAIFAAGCPTILAFSAPLTRMVLRTLSSSSPLRK